MFYKICDTILGVAKKNFIILQYVCTQKKMRFITFKNKIVF
jgi:hypothetical protein